MKRPHLILAIRLWLIAAVALCLGVPWWVIALSPVPITMIVPVISLFMPPLLSTCTIYSDNFATDKTGTDYTTVSGSFAVASGVITTGSAGAVIVSNTAGSTGHGYVIVTGKADTNGGSFRAIGSYVSSTDYVYAEVVINGGSSTLKIWNKSGSTQIGSTATFTGATNTNYIVNLCWNGSAVVASISSLTVAASGPYSGTGNKAGFGASPNGGTVTFDDFSFSKNAVDNSACGHCSGTCARCNNSIGPTSVQVVISGLGVSDGCGGFNGTFILASGSTGSTECGWCYDSSVIGGIYNSMYVETNGTVHTPPALQVSWSTATCSGSGPYGSGGGVRTAGGHPTDCLNWNVTVEPGGVGIGSAPSCSFATDSTITVTAI